MTRIVCPVCQSKYNLEQAVHEGLLHDLVDLAARFGERWRMVCEYTDCFRQAQFGSVRLGKRVMILRQILGFYEAGKFRVGGKQYRTTREDIIRGMWMVVNSDKFGFKNHNYLFRVLVSGAEKLSVEGLTAKEEVERERERSYERRVTSDEKSDEVLSAAEVARRARAFNI